MGKVKNNIFTMVNCVSCQRSFRSSLGKTKATRCESCAKFWRQQEENLNQLETDTKEKQNELQLRDMILKEKHFELEKQKVTLKETAPNGATIELTCYYDQNTHVKIRELLNGARRTLPSPPLTSPCLSNYRRSRLPRLPLLRSPLETSDCRKSRKLPNIEGLRSRVMQRYRLEEDAGSSAGSGMSVD